MWCKDSITNVSEYMAPSTASSNHIAGQLYPRRDHQFHQSSANLVDDSHSSRSFHNSHQSVRPRRDHQFHQSTGNLVDDSHSSRSFHHAHQSLKPQYFLPEPSKHNLENPNAFVGQMTQDTFVQVVANSLDKAAEYYKNYVSLPTYSEPESVFFSVSRPDIPTKDYIDRLVTYTQCSPSAFVVMLIYLDRIARSNPRLLVTPFNMHRLLVTALTLACKVLDDRCFSNVHYAKVGGIPTAREMNRLELQFLAYVKYRLHVTDSNYHEKLRSLESNPPPTHPRVPALYHGAPPTKRVDHMTLASPVTPGPAMAPSPRNMSTSFDRTTSTASTAVGSQNSEIFPARDYIHNSNAFHCAHTSACDAISQDSSTNESSWGNSRLKSPQHFAKRPRSKVLC